MSLGDYLTGLGWCSLTLATVAATTALVAARRLRPLRGAPFGLAVFLVAVATLIAAHLVPLALGMLTRATPALAGAMLALAAWRLPAGPQRDAAPVPPAPPSPPAVWALALAAAGAAAAALAGYAASVATQAFTQVDVVAFHLPGVARWIQTGTAWQVDQFLAYQAQGNYPHSGDVVALAAMLPWHSDFALRWVGLPFVVATGVAVYAIARELGAPSAASVLSGAVAVTLPTVAVSTLDFELPDAIMYATFAAGVLFLLRHARGGGRLDLGLAGVGLGLAFGVKWYAVSSVVVVIAVWTVASLLARRPWRAVAGDGARLVGLVALVGGFWLVRNLVESGNPVFPARVAPFGLSLFDAPYDRYRELAGFTLAGYVDDPTILRHYVLSALARTLGLAWIAAVAGTLLAAALAWRRPRDGRVLAVAAGAVLLAVAYLLTPYSALGGDNAPTGVAANTRYVVPGLLLALALLAWLSRAGSRAAAAVLLAGALAVADGLRRGFDAAPLRYVLLAGAVLVALAGALAAWRHRTVREGAVAAALRGSSRRVSVLAVAAGAAGLAVLAVAGYAIQERFHDNRYRHIEAPLAWVRDERERRVGLAGLWSVDGIYPVLPAFGPRLRNEVEFVGPFRDEMLVEYDRRADFVFHLRRGRFDLLVIGNAEVPGTPRRPNEAWARSAGYEVVSRSPRLVLMRRTGSAG